MIFIHWIHDLANFCFKIMFLLSFISRLISMRNKSRNKYTSELHTQVMSIKSILKISKTECRLSQVSDSMKEFREYHNME